MNVRRVAVVLTTFGAVVAGGMSSASAATTQSSSPMNHHDWCYAQHWRAGDSHWRQCDDIHGWWNQNTYRHDGNNQHDNNRQVGRDHRR